MFDITTQGITGFTGSLTSACSGNDSSGIRTPAIAITTLVWPAATTPIATGAIGPRVVSTPVTAPAGVAHDAGHRAILDDIDTHRRGRPGIAPGHGIMPGHPAAALQGGAQDRIAHVLR